MEDFTYNSYKKLDMEELGKLEGTPDVEDLPKMVIKRNLTISDVMKYLKEINAKLEIESMTHIADLKERMVIRDAKLFVGAGYKQIYMRDLAPGDISISYLLSSMDYTPSYVEQELVK